MAYPVFTPQSTPVNVSLFGDAATRGAALGVSIPSPVTSIVEGAQKGIKFATEIKQEQAQTEQIEQATENAKTQNEINKYKLNILQQTEGLQLDNTKAELEAGTAKLKNAKIVQEQSDQFFKTFQSASPQTQKQMVLSGQNSALFAQNEDLFKNVLGQLSFNPTLSATERNRINGLLKNKAIDDTFKEQAEKYYPDYLKAQNDLLQGEGQAVTNTIANTLQVAREQVPFSGEWVPSGTYDIDPTSGRVVTDAKKQRLAPKTLTPDELKNDQWDFISNQKGTEGLVVIRAVPGKQKDIQENFKSQTALQTGLEARYAKQYLESNDPNIQPAQSGIAQSGKTEISTFGGPKPQARTAEAAKPTTFIGNIQTQLKLETPEVKAIEVPVNQLKLQMEQYIKDPLVRNAPETKMSINSTVNTIARSVTDSQFKNSPSIQAQFTPSHVERYNKSLEDMLKTNGFNWLPDYALEGLKETLDVFKADTPEDLYYINHGGVIASQLNRMVYGFMSNVDAREKNAATKTAEIQNRNTYLQGRAHDRTPRQ